MIDLDLIISECNTWDELVKSLRTEVAVARELTRHIDILINALEGLAIYQSPDEMIDGDGE